MRTRRETRRWKGMREADGKKGGGGKRREGGTESKNGEWEMEWKERRKN